MRRRGRTVRSLLLIGGLVATLAGQQREFRLRARVDLVVVPVSVKGSGRLVSGLNKQDFVVLEDGRPQEISQFSPDPVPLSAAVVVDTGISAKSLSQLQKSFVALAETFSGFDEVAVYRFSNTVSKLLDFTTSKEAIDLGFKPIQGMKPHPTGGGTVGGPFSSGPVINGVPVIPPGMQPAPAPPSNVLHDAVFEAAMDLEKRDRARRKIVFLISSGLAAGDNRHSFEETLRRLHHAGIQVFAVGLDAAWLHRRFSVLSDYARTTGGDVYYCASQKAIEDAYGKIGVQARNQYVLGYVSNNEGPRGIPVFREIEVRVKQGGYELKHRRGYYQYP